MENTNGGDEPLWQELRRIQQFVERWEPRSRAGMLAIEEAYSTVVDEVEGHAPGTLMRAFCNLLRNRVSKYRRRQAIEDEVAAAAVRGIGGRLGAGHSPSVSEAGEPSGSSEAPAVLCARREQVMLVRAAVSAEEWALLWQIALGRSYEDLAAVRGVPVGTLKARVARLRMRLRGRRAGVAVAV